MLNYLPLAGSLPSGGGRVRAARKHFLGEDPPVRFERSDLPRPFQRRPKGHAGDEGLRDELNRS